MLQLLNRENASRAIVVALIAVAAPLFYTTPRMVIAAPPDEHT